MVESVAVDIDAGRLAVSLSDEIYVECDPQLVESAVFAALRSSEQKSEYHADAESCYREHDIEARDRAFAQLNSTWFFQLDLARAMLQIVGEFPKVLNGVSRCIVAPAIRRSDECAELYQSPGTDGEAATGPCLVIRLRPDSFGRPEHIRRVLLHELMHIEDMLDPRFCYDPSLAQFYDQQGVPTLIRDRYGILWDIYIDGRLFREGKLDPAIQLSRMAAFSKRFSMLGPRMQEAFDHIFEAVQLTHANILALAKEPAAFYDRIITRKSL